MLCSTVVPLCGFGCSALSVLDAFYVTLKIKNKKYGIFQILECLSMLFYDAFVYKFNFWGRSSKSVFLRFPWSLITNMALGFARLTIVYILDDMHT